MGKPTGFMDYERQDSLESRLQEWPVDVHCTTLCQSGMT